MTPEEWRAHEDSETRRREIERERVLAQVHRGLKKELTPEEIYAAKEKAREREETKPSGI